MNGASHTPTPWVAETLLEGDRIIANIESESDADGRVRNYYDVVAALGDHALSASDAAFIVRACNSHDKLVAALRAVVAWWDNENESPRGCMAMARAALAEVQS